MIFSNISAIIFSVFPPVDRGYALGWSATGTYFGLFFGPTLGGFLTQYFGWRSIFYFNVPLGVLCAYATGRIRFEWREAEGEKFDFLGAFLMAISLVFVLVGFLSFRSIYGFLFLSWECFCYIFFIGMSVGVIVLYLILIYSGIELSHGMGSRLL
ncbi:MAG TPA: MFS transporter [Methanothermobacter sp.]|jgi:MFS family permease|uniref:Major facilitator superfamily (MFS) profile domain-containing protein n=1 Tax=Methanothermobacter tenebrarum TaxID=680118 RepID=A0ABM7YD84_9EURY|nr:MFS transporter [Methanothermobacter tenebrarum]MDD3454415.1 MFS transporter [Methanobacteriales archaeon]BDH79295.1 hypothetical protein MTTB_06740 [Methanothermobacter tenebrarum]HHW16181.1 MFS transporter [Methanothermobacter sp.]